MAFLQRTPYEKLRYPSAADTVRVADVQSLANDIDSGLVGTAKLASEYSRFASVTLTRNAAQSITKATLTAISFDTMKINNGANSPLANAPWWAAGSPTRLTAPVPCVAMVAATSGFLFGSALGANGIIQTTVGLNGGTAWVQGSKFNPIAAATGQFYTSGLSMWKLNAGDFLELKVFWSGTPAGPFNTDVGAPPALSLMMVALQQVP
jgi:hypothetical protein